MSKTFANPLVELIEYEELDRALRQRKGPLQVSGCLDSQKVHLMEEVASDIAWKLIVTYDDSRAKEIYDDFGCFRKDVWLYPAKDLLFYNADIHGNLMARQRIQVLRHLIEDKAGVVVTTLDGLMDHLLPLEQLCVQTQNIKAGQDLDLEEWKGKLSRLGYERMPQVPHL